MLSIPFSVNLTDWRYMLVNDQHPLAESYQPELAETRNGKQVHKKIRASLEVMLDDASIEMTLARHRQGEAETAAANLLSGKYGAERITIVTKDPSNLLTLLEKGFRPECDITVGNMSGGIGKVRVTRNIACTPGEVESFKKLDGMEIKLFSQTVPSEVPSPFMPQLESALKQAQ